MKKFKSLMLFGLIITSIGVLVGCSNNSTAEANKIENKVVSTVKGDIEIPITPENIVDISGSTEELLILGYKPVGTANVDSYEIEKVSSYIEDRLKDVKVVGHSMMDTMDIEAILSLNPDLIIMSERQEKIYDQLKEIAPVVMIKDYANEWREKLVDVSKIFDKEVEADQWLNNYDEKAKKIGDEIKVANGDVTYLPTLATSGQFMIFSNSGIGSIINDDMELKRPNNMPKQDSITLPVVTIEGLTEIDSDNIVLIATDSDERDLNKSKVWAEMRAIKEGNITILDASPFFTQAYNPIGKELLLDSIKDTLIK